METAQVVGSTLDIKSATHCLPRAEEHEPSSLWPARVASSLSPVHAVTQAVYPGALKVSGNVPSVPRARAVRIKESEDEAPGGSAVASARDTS